MTTFCIDASLPPEVLARIVVTEILESKIPLHVSTTDTPALELPNEYSTLARSPGLTTLFVIKTLSDTWLRPSATRKHNVPSTWAPVQAELISPIEYPAARPTSHHGTQRASQRLAVQEVPRLPIRLRARSQSYDGQLVCRILWPCSLPAGKLPYLRFSAPKILSSALSTHRLIRLLP